MMLVELLQHGETDGCGGGVHVMCGGSVVNIGGCFACVCDGREWRWSVGL